jgi:Asp-tRNA(Asn)/Glu-tRNA(Gln) amidotransferase A subunit family amidase
MDHSKSEKFLKRVEVVVAVKQRMALSQTESSNDAVDLLANMVRSLTPIANQAGFVQVSLPLHFTAKPTNRRLGMCLDQ